MEEMVRHGRPPRRPLWRSLQWQAAHRRSTESRSLVEDDEKLREGVPGIRIQIPRRLQ